jgi:hypothetical protein
MNRKGRVVEDELEFEKRVELQGARLGSRWRATTGGR